MYPSVRLKTFRYGQQFVEYLELLGDVLNVSDDAVKRWIKKRLCLESRVSKNYEYDAGTAVFDNTSIADLWQMRIEIGKMMSLFSTSESGRCSDTME